MSELTKMNLIAIVQQLPDEDIEFVQQYITILEYRLQQKENIIKEVREYIESYNLEYLHETNEHNLADILEELLKMLDKVDKEK